MVGEGIAGFRAVEFDDDDGGDGGGGRWVVGEVEGREGECVVAFGERGRRRHDGGGDGDVGVGVCVSFGDVVVEFSKVWEDGMG